MSQPGRPPPEVNRRTVTLHPSSPRCRLAAALRVRYVPRRECESAHSTLRAPVHAAPPRTAISVGPAGLLPALFSPAKGAAASRDHVAERVAHFGRERRRARHTHYTRAHRATGPA